MPLSLSSLIPVIIFAIGVVSGIGRALYVQGQQSADIKELKLWQTNHTATPCTHRSKDWEGEVRGTLGKMETNMGKINDSIERLREASVDDRKWLNETFTEIRVDVATLKATRPEVK